MKKTLLFTSQNLRRDLVAGLDVGDGQQTQVGPSAESQKENLLVRAGFKAKTVTTPKQQQRSERAATRPGFHRRIQRKIVLRISNFDQR